MILLGLAKLAGGNAKGLEEFSSKPEGFTASLAPLIAIPLVQALVEVVHGDWKMSLLGFFINLCGVLMLPVVTYEFSRIFGRKDYWLRTVTALNWCVWLCLPAIFLASILGDVIVQSGLSMARVELIMVGGVTFYLIWNRWFVLKSGLKIKGWQALLVLFASLVATLAPLFLLLLLDAPLLGVASTLLP